ncbi:MAG: hypothetical protein VYA11_07225 [Planctomycetota bacterium]|nr:hypothetical protein [Planctomycetota bacterium]
MNLAILHYHLRPGGVFQVIANQLQSLSNVLSIDDPYRVSIFHGTTNEEEYSSQWPTSPYLQVSTRAVDGLGYDQAPEPSTDPSTLAARILTALDACQFFPQDTVIHVHNHSLGKNASLPGALKIIAEEGYPLLLQIHDFAEDFRVEQYQHLNAMLDSSPIGLGCRLYPQATQIHYAVLNGRDRQILSKSGIPNKRLHALPNPIVAPEDLPDPLNIRSEMQDKRGIPIDVPLVIYPVRGIRRKNLGELLLWSALFKNRASFGTTLAPKNNAEKPSYNRWKRLAENLQLPCHFELGESFSFKQNLSAADALITTSVAEGFGMVFLESQLGGRRLLGRNLPEVTTEFAENGIDLSSLYQTLCIPMRLVDKNRTIEGISAAYGEVLRGFAPELYSEQTTRRSLVEMLSGGVVDFAFLTPEMQEQLILHVHKHRSAADEILELNPLLEKSLFHQETEPSMQRCIVANREAVKNHYGPSSIGVHLRDIYCKLLGSPRDKEVIPLTRSATILESFLNLERFRPVRSMS